MIHVFPSLRDESEVNYEDERLKKGVDKGERIGD